MNSYFMCIAVIHSTVILSYGVRRGQCLSPQKLRVRILLIAKHTRYNIMS